MVKPGSDAPSPVLSETTFVISSDPDAGREYGQHQHQHHHGRLHSKLHGRHHGRERGRGPNQRHLNQHHHSVGFWDRSMSKVRAHVIEMWLKTVLILVVFVLSVMSLYWAVLFKAEANMKNLKVAIVDFDGQTAPYNDVKPFVGPVLTAMAQELADTRARPSLGYQIIPASQYDYDPMQVRRAVYDFHFWAAIVVHANASSLLQSSLATSNASYDPTGAVQTIFISARDQNTIFEYVLPQFDQLQKNFLAKFGPSWAQRIASNTSISTAMMAAAPAAVNPAISFQQIDLRPFQPSAATPGVSIGLIYLIIIAFFSFAFFLPIHTKYITPQGHPPLHFWQFILWRLFASMASYIFVSLAYSLVSLAFQIPFSNPPASPVDVAFNASAYGRGSFVVYWMLNFVGMIALGITCENVAMILGQPWTALWLIFWVITNVSTAFYSIDLAPRFFRWGYAWPLHNIVEASRQILFDLHPRIGLNFGVLFTWVAVNITLFPLCCYFMRWKMEHEKRSAERNKDRYVVETFDGTKEYSKKEGENPPIRRRGFMRGM
ncbi:MNNG and nitrosoguanidine resistance protein [Apiospora rasikravindrae]|uniref:MNNG and nitrosoguanidine resistance protein n=1 Tax=Apiospora rasikravindrae TaxID=990691 RepID=A0ABR1SWV5_9PEZI